MALIMYFRAGLEIHQTSRQSVGQWSGASVATAN